MSHQFDLAGMARLRQTVDHGHVDHPPTPVSGYLDIEKLGRCKPHGAAAVR